MKLLLSTTITALVFFYSCSALSQINVFDCGDYQQVVSQQSILNTNNSTYQSTCVRFGNNINYDFHGGNNNTVIAESAIEIQENFHAGDYLNSGQMNLKITGENTSGIGVFCMNYDNLDNIKKLKKLELGIELPSDLKNRVENFVNESTGPKLNPYLDWELRVFAEFTHVGTGEVIYIDGYYNQDFDDFMYVHDGEFVNGGYSGNYNAATGVNTYTDDEISSLGEYKRKGRDDKNFRVRFSPPKTGVWSAQIKVKADNNVISSKNFTFNVIESNDKGYLTIGNSGRFFKLSESNENYFPSGPNILWPNTYEHIDPELALYINESYTHSYTVPRSYDKYYEYVRTILAAGANTTRFIMYPSSSDIEFEELGNYTKRLHMAQELDELLKIHEDYGAKMVWNFNIHYPFMDDVYGNYWTRSKYYFPAIGTGYFCYHKNLSSNPDYYINNENPEQFFTDANSKKFYKQRLRYIIARWGYSTSISMFEMISEINSIGGSIDNTAASGGCSSDNFYDNNYNTVKRWLVEMANYVKSHYNGRTHLLNASFAGPNHPEDDVYDDDNFNAKGMNIYDFSNKPVDGWYKDRTKKNFNYNFDPNICAVDETRQLEYEYLNPIPNKKVVTKPVVFSETGGLNFETWCPGSRIEATRDLYKNAFTGMALAMNWTKWKDPMFHSEYNKLITFMNRFDIANEKWVPGGNYIGSPSQNNLWIHEEDYFDRMVRNDKKASIAYLRKGDLSAAYGVISNDTYNVWNNSSSGSCHDSIHIHSNLEISNNPDPYDGSSEFKPSGFFSTQKLKVKGLQPKNYIVKYFHRDNLNTPFLIKVKTGPKITLNVDETDFSDNMQEYLVLFKIEEKNSKSTEVSDTEVTEEIESETEPTDVEIEQRVIENFILYPNPASNMLNIKLAGRGNYICTISSMLGETIIRKKFSSNTTNINISALEKGSYSVRILKDGVLIGTKKVIKI